MERQVGERLRLDQAGVAPERDPHVALRGDRLEHRLERRRVEAHREPPVRPRDREVRCRGGRFGGGATVWQRQAAEADRGRQQRRGAGRTDQARPEPR
jgi:hypothetical protein